MKSTQIWLRWLLPALLVWTLGMPVAVASNEASSGGWVWVLPAHVPPPRVPADNPMTVHKVNLGRQLFYDPRLSVNGRVSCATCHQQSRAFTDGKPRSQGAHGGLTQRNAQPLANVAWHGSLTWANPALVTLEQQMLVPLFNESPAEMGLTDANKWKVLARIAQDPAYQRSFAAAFTTEPAAIGWDHVIKAIASFQRSLVSFDSKFDRYSRGEATLSAAERRGKNLFFGEKAECFHCHGSFNFNDQVSHLHRRLVELPFHNTGQYNLDGHGAYPAKDQGLIETSGEPDDMGKFRAPSLRNIALTAPYMHDGSVKTLAQVVRIYAAGGRVTHSGDTRGDGRRNPHKSELIGSIRLDAGEQADLVAFLRTLTDHNFVTTPAHADPFNAMGPNCLRHIRKKIPCLD